MSSALPALDDPAAPDAVPQEMALLREALDAAVPRKRMLDRNLLVATWNLKDFNGLTEKWATEVSDSPKRDFRALWAIAEIVSRFDIGALQEVGGDVAAQRTFTSTGLVVPAALNEVRRSIFADPGEPTLGKFYDQIAWFVDGRGRLIDLALRSAGGFDFVPLLYRDIDLPRSQLQYRVSDHYPLWVEFG